VNLLLDTHVALWSVTADDRLSNRAAELIADASNAIAVSIASLWEIAIKHAIVRRGAPAMPISARQAAAHFEAAGFRILDARATHIFAVEALPKVHADPFDRLIIAQARVEGMILLTSDALVARYPGDVRMV
jgi:PIN domain nuclease of toxin-antitoxin system